MAKNLNLIPDIAKMLGVELGEAFKLRCVDNGQDIEGKFYFKGNELYFVNEVGESYIRNDFLPSVLRGELEIVKLPWKPKKGDVYFTFGLLGSKWIVRSLWWGGFPEEYALLDKGWVYRSCEEAQAALPKVAAEIGVQYVL